MNKFMKKINLELGLLITIILITFSFSGMFLWNFIFSKNFDLTEINFLHSASIFAILGLFSFIFIYIENKKIKLLPQKIKYKD